jgi:hypothetical protein
MGPIQACAQTYAPQTTKSAGVVLFEYVLGLEPMALWFSASVVPQAPSTCIGHLQEYLKGSALQPMKMTNGVFILICMLGLQPHTLRFSACLSAF